MANSKTTETLAKLYLELGQVLPQTVVTERELRMLRLLARCAKCIEAGEQYKIGNPYYEQTYAAAIGLIREYGVHLT